MDEDQVYWVGSLQVHLPPVVPGRLRLGGFRPDAVSIYVAVDGVLGDSAPPGLALCGGLPLREKVQPRNSSWSTWRTTVVVNQMLECLQNDMVAEAKRTH